ncbi:MAG: saccharopine dehydrogenase NADP-binding domain-containing protein, partial [Candidatus Eremiobacterota bacterium]
MKILVLGGCGAMGTEATRDLARTSSFEEILVADIDLARAQQLCLELGSRMKALTADVSDVNALTALFQDVDVVLNCTSYKFGLEVTRAAIAAKRSLLDLGGLYNTPKQLAMNDEARAAGVTVVLGMGATPGVTNLMARAGVGRMETVDSIHVAFATFRRMAPSPGLLDTVLDEFSPSTVRFFYEDGKFVEVPPFTGEKEIEFNTPVGRQKAYIVPHSEVHALPKSFPGVKRVDVRGCWRPEIMAVLRHYNEVGLLGVDPVSVNGVSVAPKALLRGLHLAHDNPDDPGEYAFLLNVEVVGQS